MGKQYHVVKVDKILWMGLYSPTFVHFITWNSPYSLRKVGGRSHKKWAINPHPLEPSEVKIYQQHLGSLSAELILQAFF